LGCASTPPIEDVPSAESYYAKAETLLEGERVLLVFRDVDYPRAIELFQEVIDNYPYSVYATLAELRIADIHFDRGNYEEARSYYQDFVELHPNHEKVPYAIYRNGLCSFEQMRQPDQDPTPTRDAISQFQVLLERYPTAPDAPAAREMLHLAKDRLADHEIQVGDFYFRRGDYYAAVRRYQQALTSYPEHSQRLRTLAQLGHSFKNMRRYYEAEQLYVEVIHGEPEDEILDDVLRELEELRSRGVDGERPLSRSCVTDPNPACQYESTPIP
jgi:outer membrane protein assembly factor BamD